MSDAFKIFPARFFNTYSGRCPVRDWLLELEPEERKNVGHMIFKVEIGWPLGMPLCRAIKGHKGLWEIRVDLSQGRIARIFFCEHLGQMILLHAFIKKTQKTPEKEIDVAMRRMKELEP